MNICQECSKEFSSERALHAHIKVHGLTLAEYYTRHFPRFSLYTGEPLAFKNKSDYFSKDFANYNELKSWIKRENDSVIKPYILQMLKKRIELKELNFAPPHVELIIQEMATAEMYKKYFGSYSSACSEIECEPMFPNALPPEWHDLDAQDIEIFVDTREQQPLEFKNSSNLKLEFGDYAVGGEHYDYTFVDRKGEQDFKSTLSKNNLERFREELKKTKEFDSYMFIVTESDLDAIYKNNKWSKHRSNLKYIYHNMRVLNHEFAGHCQFIFSGSREKSQEIIPKILMMGKKIWKTDLQYYIDKNLI